MYIKDNYPKLINSFKKEIQTKISLINSYNKDYKNNIHIIQLNLRDLTGYFDNKKIKNIFNNIIWSDEKNFNNQLKIIKKLIEKDLNEL